ncbi:hypothetical protein [Azospirillum endophyticum]
MAGDWKVALPKPPAGILPCGDDRPFYPDRRSRLAAWTA